MVGVGEHYRPTNADVADGVYRVVGTGETVTLLRVTDATGKRVATGDVAQVSAESLDVDFASAQNPDSGLTPRRTLRNLIVGMYWDFRKFF